MKNICKISATLFTVLGMGLGSSTTATAAPVVWTFNLPSTATASQTPPYPAVATLSLSQVGSDVQFFLDPNELNSGVLPDATDSFVHQVDFVYKGAALTAGSFTYNSGALIDSFSYETNQTNMDAGYKTQDQHIKIDFFTKNNDGNKRFDFTETSTWTIAGVSLTDFTTTYATSGPKPSPIYGVISVSPFRGDSSNWVTAVPEPETYVMMMMGLGLMGLVVRRRKNQQTI